MTDIAAGGGFQEKCAAAGVHTVEVATPDTQGHLRGKRVPVQRFFDTVATAGVAIADAIFVMDAQDDLTDNPYINMDTGYLDCRLVPDLSTGRVFTHRPGYAVVFTEVLDEHGGPHPLAPRRVLAEQIERCRRHGVEPIAATELEFYLCHPDWSPVQSHIKYSSLTDAVALEECIGDMRAGLLGAGLDVESSNAEYGPGLIEVNVSYADAMTAADEAVLFKSIVKQVAVFHGLRATFMPKLWADQSGSGLHVHTSLNVDGANAFADSDGSPNELMSKWLGGLIEHARSLSLLASPTDNGAKRVRPYTFAPTHVHWGLDNRTVLARCIAEAGSPANRVEFRSAGADSNPHLMVAGVLAAGCDGLERGLSPPPMSEGDMYTNPGDCAHLPATLADTIAAYRDSALAAMLGTQFSTNYLCTADHELALATENSPDPEAVNDWERVRFAEHC